MPDREKVIKGLEICEKKDCVLCPYKDEKDETYSGFCEQVLKQDALALLKEQQNQIWEFQDQVEYLTDKLKEQEAVEPFHKCKGKSFSLIEDSNYDYCPYCGKPITWDKQEGR